jgi:hypothetical protein
VDATLRIITGAGAQIEQETIEIGGERLRARLRYKVADAAGGKITHDQIVALLNGAKNAGVDVIKTETLRTFEASKASRSAKASSEQAGHPCPALRAGRFVRTVTRRKCACTP